MRPADYLFKLEQLTDLQSLFREARIKLYYGDEAGFNLHSPVPYGWQAPGEQVERLSQHSPRLNVLGWVSESGDELRHWVVEGRLNSGRVIEAIEQWLPSLSQLTVLVLDNVSFHRSKAVQERLEAWQQAGLYVFYLPAYCPHLNKMETVWRKLKYEQLSEQAYQSYRHLRSSVEDLLANYGQAWVVKFQARHSIINSV